MGVVGVALVWLVSLLWLFAGLVLVTLFCFVDIMELIILCVIGVGPLTCCFH